MADKLGILINTILNVKQEDLQKQLDSVAEKIKINLKPRIDFDENVIAKFKSDVDKLAKNIKLNLRFDVDKQSVKDAEKTVTETATKISEKTKSNDTKLKIFNKEELDAEGRQYFLGVNNIINKVKNEFKDLGDVNVRVFENAQKQITGFEAEVKKLDGTIEKLKFDLAEIKVGDSTKEGFVFSGATLFDKNAGDVLQKNLNILQNFETRLRSIRDSFTSSRGVKEPTNLSILNREYNSILSTIEKLRKSQSNLTEEQKRNIDKQINTLNSLYKTYRDIEITAEKGFNFKQFENITGQVIKLRENLNATVVTLKNYKDALSTPLLQGYRLNELKNVQETKEYLKLTQELQKGNEFVNLTAYIDKATGSVYKYSHAARNAMTDTLTWSKAISTAWKRMAQWAVGGTLFFGTLRQIKEGIAYITELDNSLNEIRIVTNKTQQEVNNLALSYNELAKEMGVTTKEVASTAADLFRQGLDDSQVEERMKAIIQYAKISGISLEESNKIITATANATGESVEKIIDVFAMLGDITASGAEEIGEALQKVASTAENSGVSLEKAASWIATISSITRESASSIGNSLKTIISRYEQIKDKGFNEEDATQINDVTKALQAVGITAVDAQGQLRPIAEVLDELGAKWDGLTENEKAYVATALAGTYQRNRLITLLDNYSDSLKNYEAALNSAGTAEEKFAIYQESTQAALDKFRATWESLWQNTLNSDTIKTIINLGTAILNLVDKIGLLPVALSTAFGSLFLFNKTFQTFAMNIAPIVLQKLGLIVAAENGVAIAANGAALNVKALSFAFNTLAPLVIAGAIYGLVKAFDALNVSLEEYKQSVDESYNKAQSNIEQLKQWQKEYEELANKTELTRDEKAKLIEIERELKTRFGETAQAIDLQNGSLETNIKLFQQLQEEEARRFITLNERAYREAKKILEGPYTISDRSGIVMQFENIEEAIKAMEEAVRDAVDKPNWVYNIRKRALEELYEKYDNATDIVSKYEGYEKLLQQTVDETNDSIEKNSDSLQKYNDILKQLNDTIDSVQSDLKTLNRVLDDVQNGQSLNAETVLDLIQKYPELTDAIHKTADGWTIEKDAIENLRKAKIEEARVAIENQINLTETTLDKISARVEAYGIEIDAIKDLKSAQQEVSKLGFKKDFGENAFENIKFDDSTNIITAGDKIIELSKEEYDKFKQSYNEQKLINDTILKLGKLKEQNNKLLELLSDPSLGVSSSKSSSSRSTLETRYIALEQAIEKVNKALERNKDIVSKATDLDKIQLLNEQNELYREQQNLLHQLNQERRKELAENRAILAKQGFKFDAEGMITNLSHIKGKSKEIEEVFKNYLSLLDKIRDTSSEWNDIMGEIVKNTLDIDDLGLIEFDKQIENINNQISLLGDIDTDEELIRQSELLSQSYDVLSQKLTYVTSKIEEYRIELEKLQPTTDANRTKIAMLKSQLEEFEKKKIEIEIELVQKKDDLKSILDNRLNAYKSVQDKIVAMLRQQYQDELEIRTKAINEELDALEKAHREKIKLYEDEKKRIKELIDEKLKLIDREESERDYNQKLAELNEEKAEIQRKLEELSLDDSIESRNKQVELRKQLAEKEKEIAELVHDREVELRKDNLKDQLERYEKDIEAKIDAENKKYDYQKSILEQELEDVKRYYERQLEKANLYHEANRMLMTQSFDELYRQLTEFEDKFGDGMTAMGDKIREELIENLKIALGLINEINSGGSITAYTPTTYVRSGSTTTNQFKRSTDENSNKVVGIRSYLQSKGYKVDYDHKTKQVYVNGRKLDTSMFAIANSQYQGRISDIEKALNNIGVYSKGGKIDYTGLAMVHGSKDKPEYVFNYDQFKDLAKMIATYQFIPNINMPDFKSIQVQPNTSLYIDKLIEVQGNIDKSVLPDIEKVANKVVDKINSSLKLRGINRPVFGV